MRRSKSGRSVKRCRCAFARAKRSCVACSGRLAGSMTSVEASCVACSGRLAGSMTSVEASRVRRSFGRTVTSVKTSRVRRSFGGAAASAACRR